MVSITLNFEKKQLYLISAIMVFLVGVGYVIAVNPAVHGHLNMDPLNIVGSNVGIGTTSIGSGLKLDVEGKVGATEYCNSDGSSCETLAALTEDNAGSGGAQVATGSITTTLPSSSSVPVTETRAVTPGFTPKEAICAARQIGRSGRWGQYYCSYSISGNTVTFTVSCSTDCGTGSFYYMIIG
tara:strand:- start:7958 stop:8506 length:549 start_codon:yes stop_codon:yes gene_type:complete